MTTEPTFRPAEMSGNGKLLELTRVGDMWQVRFISEPRTSPVPLWFNFELSGLGASRVRLIWDNVDITLGGKYNLDKLWPVLLAGDGSWRRVSGVEVITTPDDRRQVVFEQSEPCEHLQVAFCYPYGPPDLDETLAATGDVWQTTVIGLSGEGREYRRVRLAGRADGRTRPGVYILARQHAGETPGSLVMDGLLRFIAGASREAKRFRDELDVWLMPFVDLDGVVAGNYGKDAIPWDFNRSWDALPMRPEVHALQADMKRFAAVTAPRVALDLHAPVHATPDLYHHMPRDQRPLAQTKAALEYVRHSAAQFPELTAGALPMPTRYGSRWNSLSMFSSWTWDHLDRTVGINYETSYQKLAGKVLELDDYREIGERVARTVLAWLDEQRSE